MKHLRVWNDMGVCEKWQNFHFRVEYPFKCPFALNGLIVTQQTNVLEQPVALLLLLFICLI